MPLRARAWGLGKLLVLLAALVATFFAFAAAGMRLALRARDVQVPDVVGKPVSEALQAMAERGLTLRVDDNLRSDARIPAGRITQQDPVAGAETRQQRRVRVWLSAGVRVAAMPSLVGQTERTARMRLQQDGLAIDSLSEVHSSDYPTDAIVAQSPPPTIKGARISLLVNRGEQSAGFVMPDLIGVEGARAAEVLRGRGLRVSIVGQQPYQGLPPGTIVRQQPSSGFQVGRADPISLEVSR